MAAYRETIVDRIRADHRRALERIAELERRALSERVGPREPVFEPMRRDVIEHMAAEEEFVYLLLKPDRAQWIQRSRGEHEQIRQHLEALRAGKMPAAEWVARLRALKDLVEQHAAEEERVVLPEFEMLRDTERLRDLGDEYARWTTA
jgi:iron-sulfur cluster repair protein YtfE (RIC family)